LTQQDDEGEGGRGGIGRHGARAYQAAVEAVFAIPIAAGLGWWADRHFGTDPILLLVGLMLGFASFVLRLVRMRKLVEEQPIPDPIPEDLEDTEERDER
jgi:F0F1-type ATP synthase assembly protein I